MERGYERDMRNLVGQVASHLVSDRLGNTSGEISLFQVTRIYVMITKMSLPGGCL